MPATMDDVNEMRLEAAAACGEATRLNAMVHAGGEVEAYGLAMRDAGQLVQHTADLEAWVTLRMRIEALRVHRDGNSITLAVITDVIDLMDELEGP